MRRTIYVGAATLGGPYKRRAGREERATARVAPTGERARGARPNIPLHKKEAAFAGSLFCANSVGSPTRIACYARTFLRVTTAAAAMAMASITKPTMVEASPVCGGSTVGSTISVAV